MYVPFQFTYVVWNIISTALRKHQKFLGGGNTLFLLRCLTIWEQKEKTWIKMICLPIPIKKKLFSINTTINFTIRMGDLLEKSSNNFLKTLLRFPIFQFLMSCQNMQTCWKLNRDFSPCLPDLKEQDYLLIPILKHANRNHWSEAWYCVYTCVWYCKRLAWWRV